MQRSICSGPNDHNRTKSLLALMLIIGCLTWDLSLFCVHLDFPALRQAVNFIQATIAQSAPSVILKREQRSYGKQKYVILGGGFTYKDTQFRDYLETFLGNKIK